MRRLRVGALSVVVLPALIAGGCSTQSEPSAIEDLSPEFSASIEQWLLNDMSQSQRSVLERALRGEEILFEDMEQLAADVFECFDTAGVAYTSLPPIEVAPGLLMPQYSFTEPETGLSAPDRCIDYHEFYAAMAYASQPSTVEALDREFDRNIPAMIECVRRAGVDIDDDASRAEVEAAIDAALLAAEPEMCDYRAWL